MLQTIKRAASTLTKQAGDISSVFPSLSGKKAGPLPTRFVDLKRKLAKGNEQALKSAWQRLLADLEKETVEIQKEGSNVRNPRSNRSSPLIHIQVIPSIEFLDVTAGNVSQSSIDAIRHRGVGVIRNVLPRQQALDLKRDVRSYISANQDRVEAFPADNPAVFELYWSPSQTLARAHPNMLQAQSFLSGALWHSSDPASTISTTYPLTYADRVRIRQPGDAKFALGPHTDGGSLERWEDPEYRSVYSSILKGNWEDYDPFDARHRLNATMDMYNGAGACSMFRLFQGWLAMSATGPGEGTLKVCPLLRHATAYLILRPFFDLETNELDLNSSDFPGSVFGACQEYNPTTHPHLQLEKNMVSIPHVEPGDYVAWHCDTIHAVDSQHAGKTDSSVLYIPACAVTERNIQALKHQRDSAEKWSPPPDFPGAGGEGESRYQGKIDWTGGSMSPEGKRAMGINAGLTWSVKEGMSVGEKRALEMGNQVLFGA